MRATLLLEGKHRGNVLLELDEADQFDIGYLRSKRARVLTQARVTSVEVGPGGMLTLRGPRLLASQPEDRWSKKISATSVHEETLKGHPVMPLVTEARRIMQRGIDRMVEDLEDFALSRRFTRL